MKTEDVTIDLLVGAKVLDVAGLDKYSDEVTITTDKGVFKFFHLQDCCESVWLEDFEYMELVGNKIVSAEEVSNGDVEPLDEYAESFTWTFYRINGTRGELFMRWYGSSNGYYSECVSITLSTSED